MAMIYYGKGYKAKSAKEKAHRAMPRVNHVQASKGPMESHRMCSIAPAVSDNTYEMLRTKKHIKYSAPRFLSGTGHASKHKTKFQTLRKKAGTWYKLCCMYKQFRPSESLLSVWGMVGTLSKFMFPDVNQKSTL